MLSKAVPALVRRVSSSAGGREGKVMGVTTGQTGVWVSCAEGMR